MTIMHLAIMCADSVRSLPRDQLELGQAPAGLGDQAHPHGGVVSVASPGLAAGQEGYP